MYVLFVNVPDCSVVSSVVVMVQWLAHLTCVGRGFDSHSRHNVFFNDKRSVSSSLSLFIHNVSIAKRRVSFGTYWLVTTSLDF